MRDLHPREGHDADGALRTPGGLQEVLREDDTDSGVAEAAAPAVRHLQGEDTQAEGQLCGLCGWVVCLGGIGSKWRSSLV